MWKRTSRREREENRIGASTKPVPSCKRERIVTGERVRGKIRSRKFDVGEIQNHPFVYVEIRKLLLEWWLHACREKESFTVCV